MVVERPNRRIERPRTPGHSATPLSRTRPERRHRQWVTVRAWFAKLSEGGPVVDDLQRRPWGTSDGQVIDQFGLHWLLGFEGDDAG